MNELKKQDTEKDYFFLSHQIESNRAYIREEKQNLDYEFKHYVFMIFFGCISVIFLSKYFMQIEELKLEREKFIYVNRKNDCK
jgi:hypothetical protein